MKIQFHVNRIKLFNTVKYLFAYVLTSCNSGTLLIRTTYTTLLLSPQGYEWLISLYHLLYASILQCNCVILKNKELLDLQVCLSATWRNMPKFGCKVLVYHFDTVAGARLACSATPFAVCFCSTRTTFNLFISFLPIVQFLCI